MDPAGDSFSTMKVTMSPMVAVRMETTLLWYFQLHMLALHLILGPALALKPMPTIQVSTCLYECLSLCLTLSVCFIYTKVENFLKLHYYSIFFLGFLSYSIAVYLRFQLTCFTLEKHLMRSQFSSKILINSFTIIFNIKRVPSSKMSE